MAKQDIKNWLLSHLNANRKVTVKWDCGGDESFVYPYIDGVEVGYDDEIHDVFEQFLIAELDIPDAGEFSLQGQGTIFIEDGKIVIEHSAEGTATIDYDEETEQEIFETISEPLTKDVLFEVWENIALFKALRNTPLSISHI